MTKSILARVASALLPRIDGAFGQDIWQPRGYVSTSEHYDPWYGRAIFTSATGERARRCCGEWPLDTLR
jgi:hypothetical protein